MIHKDILDRYDTMLSVYSDKIECSPNPGTGFSHLRWMVQELRSMEDEQKSMRWLGFVQGVMIMHNLTTVQIERDFTRPYFTSNVEKFPDPNELVEIQVWIKEGGMLVNAYALEPNHPMHPYNQIVSQGKRPEDYGIMHPYFEEYGKKTKNQLIEELVSIKKELESWARADAAGLINQHKLR